MGPTDSSQPSWQILSISMATDRLHLPDHELQTSNAACSSTVPATTLATCPAISESALRVTSCQVGTGVSSSECLSNAGKSLESSITANNENHLVGAAVHGAVVPPGSPSSRP